MRLNCPACTAVLDLDDGLVKKLVRCPKCQQNFVVPAVAAPVVAPKQDMKIEAPPENYDMGAHAQEEEPEPPPDPNTLKFCPGCGSPWRKGAGECKKCHYVLALGSQLKPKEKRSFNLKFDTQKFYVVIFAAALGYGLYMLYTHWATVKQFINSIWSPA